MSRCARQVINPLVERTYTILVFIVGACFFSAIYGNIAQLLQTLYALQHMFAGGPIPYVPALDLLLRV